MEFDALRQMPHSLEAEQSVLGALIIDPKSIDEVIGFLKPEFFYAEKHKQIYEIIRDMSLENKPIDFVTVLQEVTAADVYDAEEAKTVLYDMAQSVPTSAHIATYGRIVEEKARLRQMIEACEYITEQCLTSGENVNDLLGMAEDRIFEIMSGRVNTDLTPLRTAILQSYDNISKIARDQSARKVVNTHFPTLDSYLLGLGEGMMIVIGARPGVGKTAFALNIAENIGLKEKKTIAVFSLEMTTEELANRMLSSHSGVDNEKFRTGKLVDNEWIRLTQSAEILSKTEIYLDDTPGINIPQIEAKLRRLRGVDLVIIDYLQLMDSPKRTNSRTEEVGNISRSLKLMAKKIGIPVIALSQLNRASEQRTEKRPQMSDMRESGAIEQDADIIMLLHRVSEGDESSKEYECIIEKNRHGRTGIVKLTFAGDNTRFEELETRYDDDGRTA